MRVRHALPIVCAALLVPSEPARADEVPQPEPPAAAAEPVAAPAAEPVAAPAAEAPAPAPTATATPQAAPAASAQAAPPPQATPAPTAKAAATPEATPPSPAAPGPTPPGGCATPVELSGGECRVPSAVCSILGTDGDDVLTGTPMDDILCGFGGDDQLEGGDGSDVLFGGDGDDVLVGGEGGDCMVGGPGTDSADTTPGSWPKSSIPPTTSRPAASSSTPVAGASAASSRGVRAARHATEYVGLDRPRPVSSLRLSARPAAPTPRPSGIAPAGAAAVAGDRGRFELGVGSRQPEASPRRARRPPRRRAPARVLLGLRARRARPPRRFAPHRAQLVPILRAGRDNATRSFKPSRLSDRCRCSAGSCLTMRGDHFSTLRVGRWAMVMLSAAMLILLLLPPRLVWLGLFAALYGAGNGVSTILRGTAIAELFGRERYPELNGALSAPAVFAKAAAPLALAGLWSATGQPKVVFVGVLALILTGVVGLWLATSAQQKHAA